MLVSTGDHDDRVVPLHTYKYVANLQFMTGKKMNPNKPILVRVNMDQGHGGGTDTQSSIQEDVDTFGFIAKITNATWHD